MLIQGGETQAPHGLSAGCPQAAALECGQAVGVSDCDGHASTFLLREIPELHWPDEHSVVHIEPLIHEVLQTPVGIFIHRYFNKKKQMHVNNSGV